MQRPDGRMKHYFTVAGMKEAKQIAKRDPALPPLNLLVDVELNLPDEQEINTNVVLIENTLLEFDIDVDVVDVRVGPTVTQYAVQPFREKTDDAGETTFSRTRISKIASLSNDLALALSAKRLRLETPVPGQNYIGIEVPNKNPSTVALRSVYESKAYYDQVQKKKSPLMIPLGRDVAGEPVGIDLAQMPHLLDRRDDRIGQVGLHRGDGGGAGARQHARRGQDDHARPEDGRTQPLQRAAPPARSGRNRPGTDHRRAALVHPRDGSGATSCSKRTPPATSTSTTRGSDGGGATSTCPTSSS